MRTKMRAPAPDPEWNERGDLHEKALGIVASNPGYRDAVDRAMTAFRQLITAKGSPRSVERFWEAVGEVSALAVLAVPALEEMAAPVNPGPTLFAKRLIARLAEVDYERHGDPLAMEIRDELTRIAPHAAYLREIGELRELLHEDRRPHRPAGSGIRSLAKLTAPQLEAKILAEASHVLQAARPLTVERVADRMDGIGRRTLIEAMDHHGLQWSELKRVAKEDHAARKKLSKRRAQE
jgi:hypothetical protein